MHPKTPLVSLYHFLGQGIDALQQMIIDTQVNMQPVLLIVGGLFVIHLLNASLGYRLNRLGIIPRKPYGTLGIAFAPLLHGSFNHLFFNAIPLFVFIHLVLLYGWATFYLTSLMIIVISGTATWLFGRPGCHVGASALIMGYWGYLLAISYQHPTGMTLVSGMICAYYFGSMLLNLIPSGKGTSWEGHLFGLLAGIATSHLIRLV